MKKQAVLMLLLVCSFGVFGQSLGGNFVVNGQIAGLHQGKIYMVRSFKRKTLKDSCVITNGRFNFIGSIAEPIVGYFRLDNSDLLDNQALYVFLAPGDINVEFGMDPFRTISVSGSKPHDEFMEWKHEDAALKKTFSTVLQERVVVNNDRQKQAYEDSLLSYNRQKFNIEYNFAKSHPQSVITPYLLNIHYRNYTQTQLKDIYDNLTTDIRKTAKGEELLLHISQMQANSVGTLGENITGRDFIKNAGFDLNSLKGKYVVIDFWGSWCQPCIKLLPDLVKEHNKYKNKNIEFVSVATDADGNKGKCAEIIKSQGMTWTNVWQNIDKKDAGSITTIYDVRAYPTFILLDPAGKILAKGEGDYGFLTCKGLLEKLL